MGGTKGVVHKDVAQRGHFLGQRFVVLLLAFVHAAVFQHHQLAGFHIHAVGPVGDDGDFATHQFTHAFGHRGQRIFGLEFTFCRAAQVAGHHHSRPGVQRHLNARHAGAHAGVFSDVARVVLGHVQVGTDEHALASDFALGNQVRKTDHLHGGHLR